MALDRGSPGFGIFEFLCKTSYVARIGIHFLFDLVVFGMRPEIFEEFFISTRRRKCRFLGPRTVLIPNITFFIILTPQFLGIDPSENQKIS